MVDVVNLDHEAARIGHEIVEGMDNVDIKDIERCINKTLGVLQVNGVYASLLYMCTMADKDKTIGQHMMEKLLVISELVLNVKLQNNNDINAVLSDVISDVLDDIDSVLLIKDLWEQTLIYARYNARAR